MLKKKNQRQAEEEKKEDGPSAPKQRKQNPAELRLKKEFAEMDLPPHASISFPKEGDLTRFEVWIDLAKEHDCLWNRGKY